MEKTKISSRQLTIIIAVFTIGTTILVTPAAVAIGQRTMHGWYLS